MSDKISAPIRAEQARLLNLVLGGANDGVVVAGDFNTEMPDTSGERLQALLAETDGYKLSCGLPTPEHDRYIIVLGDPTDVFGISRWPEHSERLIHEAAAGQDVLALIPAPDLYAPIVGLQDELVEMISGKLAASSLSDFDYLDHHGHTGKGKGKNRAAKAWESPYASIGKKPGQRFNAPQKSGRRNRGRG
jgi:hypothetical protein